MTTWQDMRRTLEDLEAAGLRRRPVVTESAVGPRVRVGGRDLLCLCSNDYLGLADDPAVKQAAIDAIARWGVGAGASRLVSGTTCAHVELEERLARFKHAQGAVVLPTGWMANHVAIHCLAGPDDAVLCDKLNHASILDAVRSCGARLRTYPHGDMGRLRDLLERHRREHRRCLIVTDSLFSMDGDLAPLAELVELKNHYDALLMLDEAHATGVLGRGGRGLAEREGLEDAVDLAVGTLSKAIGAMGGFVTGREEIVETIRNMGRPYIYTTALPPALCAAAAKSLEIIETQPARREKLLAMAQDLRRRLAALGLDTGASQSQILPVIVGEAQRAVEVSRRLLEAGVLIPAIRPPTVPRGTSRLRISLSSAHEWEDIERVAGVLAELLGRA